MLPLLVICLLGLALCQESDPIPTPPSVASEPPSHGDVQILYTDDFMKVIEKYGITDDDIMFVTNKFKEGKPPTLTKTIKNTDTGDEQTIEVNLENFIAGGHVTDLSPILESSGESDDNSTKSRILEDTPTQEVPTTTEAPASPTREEIVEDLKIRERDLLMKLEKNRQEYEQIAQDLMEVRRDIALNTPDEYDMLSEEPTSTGADNIGSAFKQNPEEVILNDDQTPPEVALPDPREVRILAMRQALIRDAIRRYILRRRLAALTGFAPSLPREFIIQSPRIARFIPVRRLGQPFLVRISRRQIMPTPLPIVIDRRNPEIDTRPFEPIPRVTSIEVGEPGDDTNGAEPIEPTPIVIT